METPGSGYPAYSGGSVGGGLLADASVSARRAEPPIAAGGATIAHAVWSFWSAPFRWELRRGWTDGLSHLLSWVLSVRTASAHFASTSLVTDDAGADLLVNRLGLPFGTVSTSLNALRRADPGWWVLGKLHAYREQERPFLHVDSDVFLWRRPTGPLLCADVAAQNPEHAPLSDATFYKPAWFTRFVARHGGWLPRDWTRYVRGGGSTAICVGILGGRDLDTLRRYAEQGIAVVESRRNAAAWHAMGDQARLANSVLIEQYYLAACCAEHGPLNVRYVFASQDAARVPAEAQRAGYTHLMEGKRDTALTARLAERVRRDHPADFARCVGCAAWAEPG